jgi:hypothetical protein
LASCSPYRPQGASGIDLKGIGIWFPLSFDEEGANLKRALKLTDAAALLAAVVALSHTKNFTFFSPILKSKYYVSGSEICDSEVWNR